MLLGPGRGAIVCTRRWHRPPGNVSGNPKLLWSNTRILLERNGCAKLSWTLITRLRLEHTVCVSSQTPSWSIYWLQCFGLPFWTELQIQVWKPSGAEEVTSISSSIWKGGVQTPEGLVSSLAPPLGLVSKTNGYQNSGNYTNKEIQTIDLFCIYHGQWQFIWKPEVNCYHLDFYIYHNIDIIPHWVPKL